MSALILGGAPGGNWLPLLLVLAVPFALFVSGEYLLKLTLKWWRTRHHGQL